MTDDANPSVEQTTEGVVSEDLLQFLFGDLKTYLQMGKKDAFLGLFCGRLLELRTLITQLGNGLSFGTNIVVRGDPGAGKTTIIHRVLQDDDVLKALNIHPVFLDLRELGHANAIGQYQQSIISGLAEYFQAVHEPCQDLLDDRVPPVDRLHRAIAHLNTKITTKHRKERGLVLFVDDADYCEAEVLPKVLGIIGRFARSPNAVLVFACRDPVFNEIFDQPDSALSRELRLRSNVLSLPHLPVRQLLMSRLAPYLKESDEDNHGSRSDIRRAVAAFNSLAGTTLGVLPLPGLKFHYPFSSRTETFIQYASNGNVNEMFAIAGTLLRFVLRHFRSLDPGDRPRTYSIPRPELLRLFDPHVVANKFKMIDIGKVRSDPTGGHADNYLIQNVMEAVVICPYQRHELYELLGKVGFSKDETNHGIELCRQYQLIRRRVISVGVERASERVVEFLLTDRGRYYLYYVFRWPEYRQIYGASRESLSRLVERVDTRSGVYREILEPLRNLLVANQWTKGRVKVGKGALLTLIQEVASARAVANEEMLTEYLRLLKVVSQHNVERSNRYVLLVRQLWSAIDGAALGREVDAQCTSIERYARFAKEHTQIVEGGADGEVREGGSCE